MPFTPTAEQDAILNAFTDGKDLVIQAGAGTGKTTTLKMLANSTPRYGTYLAFNKAIQTAAAQSMPATVRCKTAHGLAWQEYGNQFANRMNADRPKWSEVIDFLNAVPLTVPAYDGKRRSLTAYQTARLVLDTVKGYCQTADRDITAAHIPPIPGVAGPGGLGSTGRDKIADFVLPRARKAWADIQQHEGVLSYDHSYYLKCQPPGTQVSRVVHAGKSNRHTGEHSRALAEDVAIEDIAVGDRVVSWYGPRLGRLRKRGSVVTHVGQRHYVGDLITVETPSGYSSSYTADHVTIAKLAGDLEDGNWVVYLMRRGNDYRVGRTLWRMGSQGNNLGVNHRMQIQRGDGAWVLSVHKSSRDAALAEALTQHEFGIPGWQFRSLNEYMPLDEFWAKAGGNADRAQACLKAHGRDIKYPLFEQGKRTSQNSAIEVRACNLMDGMEVCVAAVVEPDPQGQIKTGGWTGAWQRTVVTRTPYDGVVHSIEVDNDHTYIADGIVTHNCWALTDPKIGGDYLAFDEAQDANGVIAGVVNAQTHLQRIMVGDDAQSIMGFAGAHNAMRKFARQPGVETLTLTESFRFGPRVATAANGLLNTLAAPLRITGTPTKESVLTTLDHGDGPTSDAILCRTNAGALDEVINAQTAGKKVCLLGNADELRRFVEAARDLQDKGSTNFHALMAFESWAEVQDFVEQDPSGADLTTMVDLVDTYGAAPLLAALNQCVSEHRADVIVSTAHKAKGCEWDAVRISKDFALSDEIAPEAFKAELMLAYVAVTRARLRLDPGLLAPWLGQPDRTSAAAVPMAPAPAPVVTEVVATGTSTGAAGDMVGNTLTLHLDEDDHAALADAADRFGLAPDEFAVRLLTGALTGLTR